MVEIPSTGQPTFIAILQRALSEIKSFSFPIKILLAFSSFLILAQSATLPFIIDNESYYIQTIKWLNEYGFVKGLANPILGLFTLGAGLTLLGLSRRPRSIEG